MTDECPYAALYDPDFHVDQHAVFERLRERYGPVVPAELEPGVHGWVVIDYATIISWCRDTRTFSRDSHRWRDWREGRISDESSLVGMMMPRPNVLFTDGEEHRRLRRAVTDSLGKLDSARIANHARTASDQLIDAFCERGEAELLGEYARLLPLLVVNQMFGFDEESGRRFFTALREMWDGVEAERANAEIERVLSEVITDKRRNPGPDVTSWLMEHRAGLTDEEVIQQLVMIVGAGTEPSANLIANSMRVLLTDPALGEDVAGSRVSVQDAIEHVLWTAPPVTNYPVMYPTTDVSVGNQTVPEGSPVLLGYAAANRFVAEENAQQMGESANRAHLAWGVGPHRCPAQDLGTIIATTGIQTLIRRLPGLRLAVDPQELQWRVSTFSRSLTSLPVTFTAQPPTEEGKQWEQSPSQPETSTSKQSSSANSVRSSLSSFLAKLMRGR
ncbi:cytochrome P450 [Haloactinospora alba]|uniref:Cytochrome P450 n=1 Tax=Haloactinospora alba TaxID=405555 RepID=A0A543NN85_9ACTN|nr:cytochrome P450 [Haloactinospora alba]TQN33283.1 cytochrome P450 [Haloactinospora alba]